MSSDFKNLGFKVERQDVKLGADSAGFFHCARAQLLMIQCRNSFMDKVISCVGFTSWHAVNNLGIRKFVERCRKYVGHRLFQGS